MMGTRRREIDREANSDKTVMRKALDEVTGIEHFMRIYLTPSQLCEDLDEEILGDREDGNCIDLDTSSKLLEARDKAREKILAAANEAMAVAVSLRDKKIQQVLSMKLGK